MDYLPIFMNLQGQAALLVGGTEAAAQKARLLLRAGARLRIVDPLPSPEIKGFIGEPLVEYRCKTLDKTDLDGIKLVIAASEDDGENRQAYRLAEARCLPVNTVDQLDLCSFIMPAFVDRSPMMIAISSGGASPVLARLVRAKIEALLPQKLGAFTAIAQAFRQQVMRRIAPFHRRRFWEGALEGKPADLAFNGQLDAAADSLQDQIEIESCRARAACKTVCRHPERCHGKRQGEVWLVGAGPGDPDLLTNKALRLMQRCDVVLHDRLVPPAILDRIRRDAETIPVGKAPGGQGWSQPRINRLMIQRAKAGDRVMRLKCGDPMIFGRGGEERDALIEAGIAVTIVPGVTAGLAAAGEAGLALTDRRLAKQCVMMNGSSLVETPIDDLASLYRQHSTLVIYMARPWLDDIKGCLLAAGFPAETPAVLASATSRPEASQVSTSLGSLTGAETDDRQPVLLIIGEASAGAAACQVDRHKQMRPLNDDLGIPIRLPKISLNHKKAGDDGGFTS